MTAILNRERAVNSHLTICSNCGEDTNEIVQLGICDHKWRCVACNTITLSSSQKPEECETCREQGVSQREFMYDGRLEEMERVAFGICEVCEEEKVRFRKIVAEEGGLYWRCLDCRRTGVIQGESAKALRKQFAFRDGEICGVQTTKENCPVCGPDAATT